MDKKQYKYVGKSLPVEDGPAKAGGRIKYVADMTFDRMLTAKFVFSKVPHGKIKNIDVTGAAALPGVVKIFTHENAPGVRFNTQNWFVGQKNPLDQQLFPGAARFIGDPVAAVVAEDKPTAQRAVEAIKVTYEKLPVTIDPEIAVKGNVGLHEVGNPFFSMESGCGDIDAVFHSSADLIIVEDRVETQKVHHAAMENHACAAVPDHKGRITVYTPTQVSVAVRMLVATVLNVPFNKVRVIKTPIGGAFGGKQEVTLEPYCAFFAKETGRPVMLEFDRPASIVSTRTRNKVIGYVKTAVDRNGLILARQTDVIVDAGAYTSNGEVVCRAMNKKLYRSYRIPNQRYTARSVHTNTAVGGAMRGYGNPQITAVTEINLDHVARRLAMDPVELRLKNLVRPFDTDPLSKTSLGNARVIDCVRNGAQLFGWQNKWSRPKDGGRWRKGVGMACCNHVNGYFGATHDFGAMTLRMLEDGSMTLSAGIHDLGTGAVIAIKQIVAEVLDIPPQRLEILDTDTDSNLYDVGCQSSRFIYVCGANAVRTAEKWRELFIRESSTILSCEPEDVRMSEDSVWNVHRPDNRMTHGQMASMVQQRNQIELNVTANYQAPANPASYAANFAEVEVDTLTGLVKVLDFVVVQDIGQAINRGVIEGQIHGAVQMGIGFALCEDIAFHPRTAAPKANYLSKYHMVNSMDMPPVRIALIEEGEEFGPFGAKSAAEIATVPTAAAVVNAVNNALDSRLSILPLTPEKILKALSGKAE
jgi:CO/xanthine dehydrogenase Mo-binding subunit